MADPSVSRRTFLERAAGVAGAVALGAAPHTHPRGAACGDGRRAAGEPPGRDAPPPIRAPALTTRPFGRTGRDVCMLCMGTGTIAHTRPLDEVVRTLQYGLERGITSIDTAPSYGAEEHVGRAIAGRRQGLFLATKTLERGYDGAMKELETSLKKLGTERLDLWQVHAIGHHGDSKKELASLRKADGVMKAMCRMREQKVVDLIGFTGHAQSAYMLDILRARDLDFDTMLFIISAALVRRNQAGWENDVLPEGRRRGLGLIAMKVFGGGSGVGADKDQGTPAELLRYVWDRGLPTANVGLYSPAQIDAAVDALRAYTPPNDVAPADKPPAAPGDAPADSPSGESGARRGGPRANVGDRVGARVRDDVFADRRARDAALRDRFHSIRLPFERPGYVDGAPLAATPR
ncbi:MAG: aldo/keto reductase [Phycisphaerae bacterium]